MIKRSWEAIKALLKSIDILSCTIWLAPLYVLGLADKPSGRQMISSYVGKAKYNGYKWAIPISAIIDKGAEILGNGKNHCIRAYLHYRNIDN